MCTVRYKKKEDSENKNVYSMIQKKRLRELKCVQYVTKKRRLRIKMCTV